MKKLISLGQAVKSLRKKDFSNSYFLYGDDIFMQDFFINQFKKLINDTPACTCSS